MEHAIKVVGHQLPAAKIVSQLFAENSYIKAFFWNIHVSLLVIQKPGFMDRKSKMAANSSMAASTDYIGQDVESVVFHCNGEFDGKKVLL